MSAIRPALAAFCFAFAAGPAFAQAARSSSPSIYVCVDAKGRRITSDRPIMECLDREQKQYGSGGTVQGTLPPSMTADERAAAEEKARRDTEDRQRVAETRRRDRLLVNRYPDEASHERERAASLQRLDDAIASGERRLLDLQRQREDLLAQQQASATDVIKAQRIKRALSQNEESDGASRRLLEAQRDERQRIATRFDEERERLKVLWAQQVRPAKAAAPRS
ncbi:DUF4124 domain-containing protein [Ramlibacter algicola]|uniref:DUF4124 domain-containing protein n=1 Tax=Ramlibacter algicola TaxID=2795217 RepID=A0A934UQ08_9BURK|nr:DUF4124 domain-containing protein [Ramlibacter algicola]MBK0391057.1 DUF4124 domain-containing protein [Ramlibacter algicola]